MNKLFQAGLITTICNRVTLHNQDFISIFVGEKGTGKSYSAIKFAEETAKKLGLEFTIENIVFTPRDAIRILQSDFKAGSAIVFDEAGLELFKQEWYKDASKKIIKLLQSMRYKRPIFIFTTPSLRYLHSGVPPLSHMIFQTVGSPDKEKNQVRVKPFIIQTNPMQSSTRMTGKDWIRRYPFVYSGGKTKKLMRVLFGLPSEELRKAYEIKRDEFIKATFKEEEKVEVVKKYPTVDEVAKMIVTDQGYYIKTLKGKKTLFRGGIASLGMPRSKVQKYIRELGRRADIQEILIEKPLSVKPRIVLDKPLSDTPVA